MFYLTRIIGEHESIDRRVVEIGNELKATCGKRDFPIEVIFKKAKSKRSISQNALYWEWMSQMGVFFSRNGIKMDKEKSHELMQHTFLGYREWTTPKGELIRTLKTTTALSVGEFSHYLSQIDAWAAEKGLMLTRPEDNDYEIYRQQMDN